MSSKKASGLKVVSKKQVKKNNSKFIVDKKFYIKK